MAHNLARWTLRAAGADWQHATTDTLRTKLVTMPARLAHTGRRLKLRAPTNWPWRDAFEPPCAHRGDPGPGLSPSRAVPPPVPDPSTVSPRSRLRDRRHAHIRDRNAQSAAA
ncbi:MAG: hypothetical protein GEU73_09715 [Chloroflexi bacterium]|nr:hypothetical protein [Chloroflexota bacterium]